MLRKLLITVLSIMMLIGVSGCMNSGKAVKYTAGNGA